MKCAEGTYMARYVFDVQRPLGLHWLDSRQRRDNDRSRLDVRVESVYSESTQSKLDCSGFRRRSPNREVRAWRRP